MSDKLKKRKLKLFEQNNRCYYCNQPTVLIAKNKFDKLNLATIEHLFTKYSLNRHKKHDGVAQRTVLACHFLMKK